jgi:hypothetical protein
MRLIESHASRIRQCLQLALSALVVATLTQRAFAQRTEGHLVDGVLDLRVENESDPLFFAIEKLSDLCRCPISFEEPEWTHSSDVEVVRYPNGTRNVRIVKRGSLRVVSKVDDRGGREWIGAVLQDLLAQHDANGSAVLFRVAPGPPLTVRPQSLRNPVGDEVLPPLLLDTEISLDSESMPIYRWVDRLARELSQASGRTVRILYPPRGPALENPVTFGAKAESARSVLRRLFADSSADVAWLVSHSPELDLFAVKLKFFAREP